MAAGTRNYGAAGAIQGRSLDQFKGAFFDREAVLKLMDRATAKALSKFGAFVRRRAQTSLRYRTKASAPGSPPSAHKSALSGIKPGNLKRKNQPTSPLRGFIFFAYDKETQSVIIGPAKTNQVFFEGNRRPVTGTVPSVLEYGGSITILEWFRAGKWERADLRSRRRLAERPTRFRTIDIAARPFMGPAFQAELPQLIEFFRS